MASKAPKRGAPLKGKVAITYRYQPKLPVYDYLQMEAERRGTSLQEEMHRALDEWFTGRARPDSSAALANDVLEVEESSVVGARAAADAFM